MQVVLLERVAKLGQMGEVVRVRDGFARNFLLPQGKALRATPDNMKRFEAEKSQLEARNLDAKREAEGVAAKLDGEVFVVIRSASDSGALYGSVTTRDIAEAATEAGFSLDRRQVALDAPIKELGLHEVTVVLHPEVDVTITLNVARTREEAEIQAARQVGAGGPGRGGRAARRRDGGRVRGRPAVRRRRGPRGARPRRLRPAA
jgi:large subunit ribosomal protein L9